METEYPGYFFRNCSIPLLNCTSETHGNVRSCEYLFLFIVVFIERKKMTLRFQGPRGIINDKLFVFPRAFIKGEMNFLLTMKLMFSMRELKKMYLPV